MMAMIFEYRGIEARIEGYVELETDRSYLTSTYDPTKRLGITFCRSEEAIQGQHNHPRHRHVQSLCSSRLGALMGGALGRALNSIEVKNTGNGNVAGTGC